MQLWEGELWNIFNGKKIMGEQFRVFPLSNWTEMDVWQYIYMEDVEIPDLYFTHKRNVFYRDGVWLADAPFMAKKDSEEVVEKDVRYHVRPWETQRASHFQRPIPWRKLSRKWLLPGLPSGGDGMTTNAQKQQWKTGKRKGIFSRQETGNTLKQ